jgi:hypothetical protein
VQDSEVTTPEYKNEYRGYTKSQEGPHISCRQMKQSTGISI